MKFSSNLITEALRQGLKHIHQLDVDSFKQLVANKRIKGHVTEKSDGMAFEVGHDEHGFFTRTSRSDKMRHAGDYLKAAKAKFGDDVKPEISAGFDQIHHHLHSNKHLTTYLKNTQSSIKGEMYHVPSGEHVDQHHIRFVGTAYDKRKMGKVGTFVMHHKLGENKDHQPSIIHHLGDEHIKFDHDKPNGHHEVDVDVHDLHNKVHALDNSVMQSRKHADKDRKAEETEKFTQIKHEADRRIREHLNTIKPKWGPETEGYVIHPHESNPSAPRVKVVDHNFMTRKHASARTYD